MAKPGNASQIPHLVAALTAAFSRVNREREPTQEEADAARQYAEIKGALLTFREKKDLEDAEKRTPEFEKQALESKKQAPKAKKQVLAQKETGVESTTLELKHE